MDVRTNGKPVAADDVGVADEVGAVAELVTAVSGCVTLLDQYNPAPSATHTK